MKLLVLSSLGVPLLSFVSSISLAQQPKEPRPTDTTIRVESSLVLIDVITQDPKNGLPVRDFKKEDFRMFNDGKELPISAFDAGARYDTRPVNLWLAVICNERGKVAGSAEFMGKEELFQPALDQLDKRDTVGVAHWCDNGDTQLDLLPTNDRDSPITVLTKTILPIPFAVGGNSNVVGEATFRKMIRLIIRDAIKRNPQPLPVIVFLYGGRGAQPADELDDMIGDILETSGIVFGIKDRLVTEESPAAIGERGHFIHYIVEQTGGQYFSVPAENYAAALETILTQLHFRYELGFVPPVIDGKRHEIKVELTKEAREQHQGVRLRHRTEYIAVREEPDWAR